MPKLVFNISGDIDDAYINKSMFILGELIVNEIKKQVRIMKLQVTGDYLQGWFANWDGKKLDIDNRMPYAPYLEYGTFTFGGSYTVNDFPGIMFPKKKDLPRAQAAVFPKGMQPFAPVRRVLYNETKMKRLIRIAFKGV